MEAGDALVDMYPCWSWSRADEHLYNHSLPKEKQFLVLKSVLCSKRIKDLKLENNSDNEVNNDMYKDWIVTEKQPSEDSSEIIIVNSDTITREISMHNLRTYDLHILYDSYYKTPHLYLIGYDHNGMELTLEEMREDVDCDYINRTVTYERHPLLNASSYYLSIHPCMHSRTMVELYSQLSLTKNEVFGCS